MQQTNQLALRNQNNPVAQSTRQSDKFALKNAKINNEFKKTIALTVGDIIKEGIKQVLQARVDETRQKYQNEHENREHEMAMRQVELKSERRNFDITIKLETEKLNFEIRQEDRKDRELDLQEKRLAFEIRKWEAQQNPQVARLVDDQVDDDAQTSTSPASPLFFQPA